MTNFPFTFSLWSLCQQNQSCQQEIEYNGDGDSINLADDDDNDGGGGGDGDDDDEGGGKAIKRCSHWRS